MVDTMLIYATDLERAIRAAGIGKREFLRRVEKRHPKLAQMLRQRFKIFKITTMGELWALRSALNLSFEKIDKEGRRRKRLPLEDWDRILYLVRHDKKTTLKEMPFENAESMGELANFSLLLETTFIGRAVLGAVMLSENRVKRVGEMLARWRSELGVSQGELARRTGLRHDIISKLELGQFKDTSPFYKKKWESKCQRVIRALERIEEQKQRRKT